jgi:hypothetical protein
MSRVRMLRDGTNQIGEQVSAGRASAQRGARSGGVQRAASGVRTAEYRVRRAACSIRLADCRVWSGRQ